MYNDVAVVQSSAAWVEIHRFVLLSLCKEEEGRAQASKQTCVVVIAAVDTAQPKNKNTHVAFRGLVEAALLSLGGGGGQGGISVQDVLWLRNDKMLELEGVSAASSSAARAQKSSTEQASGEKDDKGQLTAVENGIQYQVERL